MWPASQWPDLYWFGVFIKDRLNRCNPDTLAVSISNPADKRTNPAGRRCFASNMRWNCCLNSFVGRSLPGCIDCYSTNLVPADKMALVSCKEQNLRPHLTRKMPSSSRPPCEHQSKA